MTDYLDPSPCWILWDKGFSEDVTFAQFEMAWTSFNSSCKKYDKHPSQNLKIHPTQKPISLYKWLLKRYANTGDIIFDSHMGSGSIAIACNEFNFDFHGCEIDKDYYSAALKRFDLITSQSQLF